MTDRTLRGLIYSCKVISLPEIATAASQSQIRYVVRAVLNNRYYMLYFKRKVEDYLRCVTVFTPMPCPFGHEWVVLIH